MNEAALDLLRSWVLTRVGSETDWVSDSLAGLTGSPGQPASERDLHIFLGFAPRRLGKADLVLSDDECSAAEAAHPGWRPQTWSLDGAARVLALLCFRGARPFAETFKDLRRTADAAEMIALYRGLPLYPNPDALDFEVGEGLRSNLKPVFEAIAHDNPFPHDQFDDHRWNHMVLKALFVESQLSPIIGLDARANEELARILVDYAHERWAAGRVVTPELWRPVRPFRNHSAIRPQIDHAIAEGRLAEEDLS